MGGLACSDEVAVGGSLIPALWPVPALCTRELERTIRGWLGTKDSCLKKWSSFMHLGVAVLPVRQVFVCRRRFGGGVGQ